MTHNQDHCHQLINYFVQKDLPEQQYCLLLPYQKRNAKKDCSSRESNPGLIRGRDLSYHLTTSAVKICLIPFHLYNSTFSTEMGKMEFDSTSVSPEVWILNAQHET